LHALLEGRESHQGVIPGRVPIVADPSLIRFRAVVEGALAELEARRREVNDLNVFPVADGDTGDNMALTLRAVLDELDRLSLQGEIDEIGRDEIVDSVARAALLGARGNSGVILSQLLRGAAEELISRPGELIDPVLVAAAMARAAERAYGSVREPAEGTILTVVREMAAKVSSDVAHMDEPRLLQHVDDDAQNALIAGVLESALRSGELSVARGPELLPILREAGVVDAGGYGLTVMFAGVIAALRGSAAPDLAHHSPARITHPQHDSTTFRYCTNFAVTGEDLDPVAWNDSLERFGDSVLVVGDTHTLKVHLHTDEPERATALFAEIGEVSHLDVADMTEQVAERTERLAADAIETCGVLAVVAGGGVRELFESLGAVVLDGGSTLNPSTYELLAGIHDVPAEEVVVLPNSPNVIMAAEKAAELADKRVHVVPSRSMQAGLAAAVALDPTRGAAANAAAMLEALENVRTGAVTGAARDDAEGRFRRGEAVGFIDEQLVAWGEPEETLEAVLGELGREAELLTLLEGSGAPIDGDTVAGLAPGGVDVEYSRGDQPAYWWLIAAE
jgi:DAK2 domain fusion protein YloV